MKSADLKISCFLFSVLLFCAAAEYGTAKEFFAMQYKMQCDQCHTKVPRLNPSGQNFKDNGYAFINQSTAKREAERQRAERKKRRAAEQLQPEVTQPDAESPASPTTPIPLPPPEVPTQVYQLQSNDGSIYFTDNPLQKPDDRIKQKERTDRKSKRKEPVRTASLRLKAAVISRPEPEDVPIAKTSQLPQNFSNCMERFFINRAPPQSVAESIAEITEAGHVCAPFTIVEPQQGDPGTHKMTLTKKQRK